MSCSFKNNAVRLNLFPKSEEKYDLLAFLEQKREEIILILEQQLQEHNAIKWYLTLKVKFEKTDAQGEIKEAEPYFSNKCIISFQKSELKKQVATAYVKILDRFTDWIKEGSGWFLEEVKKLIVSVVKYRPIKGTSFIKLPLSLSNKKAIVNIKNKDEFCFVWCILAALFPAKDHPDRTCHYKKYFKTLNLKGLTFPLEIRQISKFEKQNKLNVNVYQIIKSEIYPAYISKVAVMSKAVDLLLIKSGNTTHYCLIRHLSRLLRRQGKHSNKKFYCSFCLHAFTTDALLQKHDALCRKHDAQKVVLPNIDENILKFKNYHKQDRLLFAIYCDFESLLLPSKKSNMQKTQITQEHVPCAFSYVVVCSLAEYSKPIVSYRGKGTVQKFIDCLRREEKEILDILYTNKPITMTGKDWDDFLNNNICHICGKEIGANNLRARDHFHLTGEYRGVSHTTCNLSFKLTKKIPIIFHNLKNYDGHIIMQGIHSVGKERITCIPKNMEKYITFGIGKHLKFLDSFQFLSSSLDTLVTNLKREGASKFQILAENLPYVDLDLLLQKQPFPYEYFDSWEKLDETSLPSQDSYFSSLSGESISDAQYELAKDVWRMAKIKTLGDMCEFYVKTDTLLLACVMENFRNLCLKYYKLDPLHFVSLPGLSFEACLKLTGVELELLTDPDQYLFLESGIRGGISVITERFARANNRLLENYEPNKKDSYIVYYDCTGLYSWALRQPLPKSGFKWIRDAELLNDLEIPNLGQDGQGYILEVDLEYPKHLHNKHNAYPLAPQKMKISRDMLSHFMLELLDKNGTKYGTSNEKLVPNLFDKQHYVVHYRALQTYLDLGLKLKKVHRALTFKEESWVKPYVDFNTEKRKHAKSTFEQDLFKLMLNSFFGKTMENVRKRQNVELVTDGQRFTKLVSKPTFESFKLFNTNLAGIHLRKLTVQLNKPIYIGFSILDLSKMHMYQFHYNHILKKYGGKAKLLFTDTDSLCYKIQTTDVYRDMLQHKELFDTSNYPKNHFLFDESRKKVVGLFKDETAGAPIYQFVGLRPKLYSILLEKENKRTAKGIAKATIRKHLRHEQYLKSLYRGSKYSHEMMSIRSKNHKLYTYKIKKTSLSPLDDKRYLLKKGVKSYAYGHFLTESADNERKLAE